MSRILQPNFHQYQAVGKRSRDSFVHYMVRSNSFYTRGTWIMSQYNGFGTFIAPVG